MDVYMDDILVKYNKRLNVKKCVFGMNVGKFLRFIILIEWGIKSNPTKCQAIIDMKSPTNVKEVKALIRGLVAFI